MKKHVISVIIALCMILMLCACGSDNDELIYTPNATTEQADRLFETNAENELINLSLTMAGNNDYKEEQNNYFNYLLAKIAEIDENNINDKYTLCLNVMKKCLKEPLTQANVISGFKQLYFNIDTKLSQETMEYMKGEWLRIDKTGNTGMKAKVEYDEELGLIAKISALPEGATSAFRIGDIKWNNIEFANYTKFYLNDLVIEESSAKTYFKNESKTTSSLKGATATIDIEKGTLRIKYDSASGVTSGSNQLWAKIGSDSEKAYRDGTFYATKEESDENEDVQSDEETNDTQAETTEEDEEHTSVMSDFSLSNVNVEDTTKTVSTEKSDKED